MRRNRRSYCVPAVPRAPAGKIARAPAHLVAIALATIVAAGCAPPAASLVDPTPPMVLVPASYAGLVDGRGRFREIFTAVREDHGRELPNDRPVDDALHALAGEPLPTGRPVHLGAPRAPLRVVIVPGLFGEYVQDSLSPFPYARLHLETHGYRTDTIVVGGRSSCAHNALQVRDAVIAADLEPGERMILVGYSKGGIDCMTAVTMHPEIRDRVAAVLAVCSPIGGSTAVDDLDGLSVELLEGLRAPGLPLGDGGAVDSLRPSTRRTWLAAHELPASVRFYSLAAFTERGRTSSIHHSTYDALATIDPRNDGQVLIADAIIPRGTLLGYVNCDHWAAACAFDRDHPLLAGTFVEHTEFPREVLLEAVVRFIEEDLADAP